MRVKLRQDLEYVSRRLKRGESWVVKDPVSFQHFLFTSQELELAKLFNGIRSDAQIQEAWQKKFGTRSLTLDQVQQFANRLIRDNLVNVDDFGFGRQLLAVESARNKAKIDFDADVATGDSFSRNQPRRNSGQFALGWLGLISSAGRGIFLVRILRDSHFPDRKI